MEKRPCLWWIEYYYVFVGDVAGHWIRWDNADSEDEAATKFRLAVKKFRGERPVRLVRYEGTVVVIRPGETGDKV